MIQILLNVPNVQALYTFLELNADLAQLVHSTEQTINVRIAKMVAILVYHLETVLMMTNANVTPEMMLANYTQSEQQTIDAFLKTIVKMMVNTNYTNYTNLQNVVVSIFHSL